MSNQKLNSKFEILNPKQFSMSQIFESQTGLNHLNLIYWWLPAPLDKVFSERYGTDHLLWEIICQSGEKSLIANRVKI